MGRRYGGQWVGGGDTIPNLPCLHNPACENMLVFHIIKNRREKLKKKWEKTLKLNKNRNKLTNLYFK